LKPAIIGGSICHAFNPDSSLSNFLLDFLFAGLNKKDTPNNHSLSGASLLCIITTL
jgi:hypothetical protein